MERQSPSWWRERKSEKDIDHDILILEKRKLIYVTNQKVACSTLKATLWRWYIQNPDLQFGSNQVHKRAGSPFSSPRDLGFHEFMSSINSPEYQRICFVRNPYTRLLSCYMDKINNPKKKRTLKFIQKLGFKPGENVTLAEFVERIASQSWYDADPHWRAQTEQLLWGGIRYDFVGRFEVFTRELDRLAIECDVDLRDYVMNMFIHAVNAERHVSSFYTEELQERVYDLYRSDFEAFGYEYTLPCLETG